MLSDVLAEVFGMWGARCVILLGPRTSPLASLISLAAGVAPTAPGYENQEVLVAVLGFVLRAVVASLAGYLVG